MIDLNNLLYWEKSGLCTGYMSTLARRYKYIFIATMSGVLQFIPSTDNIWWKFENSVRVKFLHAWGGLCWKFLLENVIYRVRLLFGCSIYTT